jgi:site-specific DNA-methyltransferase (adenine-specific)
MISDIVREKGYVYYEEPNIILLHGDCLEILPLFEPKSFDLVLTSPPYDNLRDYGGYIFEFEGIAQGLSYLLSEGGVIVWVVGDATINGSETGTSFKQALYFKEQCGLNLHDTMIYMKDACPFPEINRYYPSFEYMFVLSQGKPKTVNLIADKINKQSGDSVASSTQREKDGTTRAVSAKKTNPNKTVKEKGIRQNVWLYSPGKNKSTKDIDAYKHPAIFPEALARDHIMSWSNEGDIILDCFMGSGTTAKIAKQLGRKCVGIELESKYLDIAIERLRQEQLF